MYASETTVLLRPRPYARFAGILLVVPLLSGPKPLKPLPAELWVEIFAYVLEDALCATEHALKLGNVCRTFHVCPHS